MALKVEGTVTLLQVFDLERSLAFYRDVLGFELVQQSRENRELSWVWLRLCDAELMLNTMYEEDGRPSAPPPERVAAHGDTALFFGCRDLDAAHAHLRSHGLDVAPPVTRAYGMRQLQVVDPDGYGLCFQWPAS
jgi:catechol 2,3-dioxygenase-like lactoylglutathione lyase family enzyme